MWFYGGAYMSGASSDPLYDASLIARQGLVVVAFNYRVGLEGFAQLGGAPVNRPRTSDPGLAGWWGGHGP